MQEDEVLAAGGNIPQRCGKSSADVERAARAWLGTPYHHQASTIGIGCDCLGLVRGIWREIVGPEPQAMPNYSPAWDEVSRRDDMLDLFGRYLQRQAMPADRSLTRGDVVIFRMRATAVAKHCGIIASAGIGRPVRLIHSHSGRGVVEVGLTDYWRARVAAVFTFPGVGI